MAEHKKLRASFEEVSGQVTNIINTLNQVIQMVQNTQRAIQQQGEVIGALVSLFGENMVQDEVNRMRKERQEKFEAQQAEMLKPLVEAKVLIPEEAVTAESFVVGTATFKDGRSQRLQIEVATIPPDDQKRYVGLTVGGSLELGEATVSVVEIYRIDKAAAEVYAAEQQKKALQAQAQPIEPAKADPVEVEVVANDAGAATEPPVQPE